MGGLGISSSSSRDRQVEFSRSARKNALRLDNWSRDKSIPRPQNRLRCSAMYTSAASQISLICPGERYGSGLWNDDVACCDCAIGPSPLCVEMFERGIPREVRTLGTTPTHRNLKRN